MDQVVAISVMWGGWDSLDFSPGQYRKTMQRGYWYSGVSSLDSVVFATVQTKLVVL